MAEPGDGCWLHRCIRYGYGTEQEEGVLTRTLSFIYFFVHRTVYIMEVVSMTKYIPYEKLSKKEKRKADSSKRNTWGSLNPVTRKPENSRAYDRNKAVIFKGHTKRQRPNDEDI